MSFAWSTEVAGSDLVARGIQVLQRNAAHDVSLRDRAATRAREILAAAGSLDEWVLISRVAEDARVNESVASSAVWSLCDAGVLQQNWETLELSLAR